MPSQRGSAFLRSTVRSFSPTFSNIVHHRSTRSPSGSTFNLTSATYARFWAELSPLLLSIFLPYVSSISNGGDGGRREARISVCRGATQGRLHRQSPVFCWLIDSSQARFSLNFLNVHLSPGRRFSLRSNLHVRIQRRNFHANLTYFSLSQSGRPTGVVTLYKITFVRITGNKAIPRY